MNSLLFCDRLLHATTPPEHTPTSYACPDTSHPYEPPPAPVCSAAERPQQRSPTAGVVMVHLTTAGRSPTLSQTNLTSQCHSGLLSAPALSTHAPPPKSAAGPPMRRAAHLRMERRQRAAMQTPKLMTWMWGLVKIRLCGTRPQGQNWKFRGSSARSRGYPACSDSSSWVSVGVFVDGWFPDMSSCANENSRIGQVGFQWRGT